MSYEIITRLTIQSFNIFHSFIQRSEYSNNMYLSRSGALIYRYYKVVQNRKISKIELTYNFIRLGT